MEKPDSMFGRIANHAAAGFMGGAAWGATRFSWQHHPGAKIVRADPSTVYGAKVALGEGLWFASIFTVFAATEKILEDVRGTDDVYNSMGAAAAAGALVGVRMGTPAACIGGAVAGAASAGFVYATGGLTGSKPNLLDEYVRKMDRSK
eukprot:tig00000025_g7917.t1